MVARDPDNLQRTDDAVLLGQRAQALLRDETFAQAMEAVRQDAIKEWEIAETTEAREAAWHKLNGLAEVKRCLEVFIERQGDAHYGE